MYCFLYGMLGGAFSFGVFLAIIFYMLKKYFVKRRKRLNEMSNFLDELIKESLSENKTNMN